MKATETLATARDLVAGDRAEAYGDCLETHRRIAAQWTQTLTLAGMMPAKPIDAHTVAWLLSDLKKVRAYSGPFRADNYTDGAAYVALAGEVRQRSEG